MFHHAVLHDKGARTGVLPAVEIFSIKQSTARMLSRQGIGNGHDEHTNYHSVHLTYVNCEVTDSWLRRLG